MSVAGSICVRAVSGLSTTSAWSPPATRLPLPRGTGSWTPSPGASSPSAGQDLSTLAGRAYRLARDTTVLMLLTGSVIPFRALKAAAVYFGPDVRVIALRCEPDAPPGINSLWRPDRARAARPHRPADAAERGERMTTMHRGAQRQRTAGAPHRCPRVIAPGRDELDRRRPRWSCSP